MKVLAPGRPVTDEIVGRFLREIQLLARLHHPNITALHTAFRHEGQLVMIMEFVEGQTLSARFKTGPMILETNLSYIQQVLSGLAYAHEHGIVHRDVKPSNIMVAKSDHVKLLDFGLAHQVLSSEFTRSGTILGSLHYMSPEQVMGEQLDARSDIYSVGVTLYQLVTGRLPFDGPSEYAIASGHLKSVPIDPLTLNSNLPPGLSKVVLKALAKPPGGRFQTAREFLKALSSLRTGETTTVPMSPYSDRAPNPRPDYGETTIAFSKPEKPIFEASVLEAVSRDLAHYVGPIAKIVVSRAAKQALTVDDLYTLVAAEISAENKRSAFLAARPKSSTSK